MMPSPRARRPRRRTPLLLAAACLFPTVSRAATTYTWLPTAPDAFNHNTAWNPAGVPVAGDTAVFSSGVAHTVNFTAAATTTFLKIANDAPTFNFSPGVTYVVTTGSNVVTGAQLGLASGQNARLTLTGAGTFAPNSFSAADVAGSNSSVTVQSGATLDVDGIAYIARSGTADLLVTAAGHVISRDGGLYLAFDPASSAKVTVEGAGSTLHTDFPLVVGYQGAAILNVTSGASVDTGNTQLAAQNSATATLTISGSGTTWTDHGAFHIGEFGQGSLTVSTGAHLSTPQFVVGQLGASTATLDGASSRIDGGQTIVGNGGTSSMTVSNGATLTSTTGTVGLGTAGTSSLTIQDPGSTWTNSGQLFIGSFGNGSLTIRRGASVSNTRAALAGDTTTTATVSVDEGTWTTTGDLIVGNSGHATLTLTHGGVATASGTTILGQNWGNNPVNQSAGSIGVDGTNSRFSCNGYIYVGVNGVGQLGAQNKGRIESLAGVVGATDLGHGQVGISGAGSIWSITNGLLIGNGDVGITSSGSISSNSLAVGDPSLPAIPATLQMDNAATYTATSSALINPNGTLSLGLTPATPSTLTSPSVDNKGFLLGSGVIQGNLTSSGTISPGDVIVQSP